MQALRQLPRSGWCDQCEGGVNKTLALHHLPRSGWSFGRAGLGAKATYPARLWWRENKAVGLGLFPFNALVGEDFAQYFPTLPIVICLPFDTINPANAVSFIREHPASLMQTNQ